MNRITCSEKATHGVLANGVARGHRANPIACLKVVSIYGTPVLLSGLGALVLNHKEIQLVEQHQKSLLQNFQKLHNNTPKAFIFFMAGSLPATAPVVLVRYDRQTTQ